MFLANPDLVSEIRKGLARSQTRSLSIHNRCDVVDPAKAYETCQQQRK